MQEGWLVRVEVGGDGIEAELVCDALWAEGATAVEIGADRGRVVLLAGFPTDASTRDVAVRLSGPHRATLIRAADGWQDTWKQWMEPVAVGRRLVVAPAWKPVPVGEGRLVVEIDPGACFGSGTHPSTRLILGRLDADPPAGLDVIDVGCGSGILSVAAARLGARSVTAVDTDPEAVAVTVANARRNGVSALVEASTTAAADLPGRTADLALVNVTAGVHAAIGESAARLVRAGGRLVVAGLLPGQWRHVESAYRGLMVVGELSLDGWEGAVLEAPGA